MATLPYGVLTRAQSLPVSARSVDVSSADFADGSGVLVRVGGAGNVTYRAIGSRADVAEAFAAGDLVPCVVSAIRNTGTTATGLVAYGWERLIDAPGAVQTLAASVAAGHGIVVLTWTAPADDGGADLDRYEVRRGTQEWIAVPIDANPDYRFEDLPGGSGITFGVRAVNIEGLAGPISTVTAQPTTAPPPPPPGP